MVNNIIFQSLGFIGAFLMNFSAIPQIVKMIKTQSVRDLNIRREFLLLFGVLFYLSYAIYFRLYVVMFSNLWALSMFMVYIYLYYKYDGVDKDVI